MWLGEGRGVLLWHTSIAPRGKGGEWKHSQIISSWKAISLISVGHLCPEMRAYEIHSSLWRSITKCHFHITSYLTELCVLVTFYVGGHFVTLIMKSMHLITLHFWKSLCNVHTTQEKYENGALFLRFGLPSTLIRHENAALCTSQIEASTTPPPGNPPGIWIFRKFLLKFPPHRAEKLFKCPHPRENYQITVLLFSSFYCASEAVHAVLLYRFFQFKVIS